jgi:preprotein translocase subunit SecF
MGSFASLGNRLYTGETSLDIVRRQKTWYTISAVLLLISLGALGIRGLTLGLEFTGGSEFRISGAKTTSDLPGSRAVTDVVPSATPKVARVGNDSVRVQTDKLSDRQTDQVRQRLATAYGVQTDDVTASFVGPSWGRTVSTKALTGLLVFLALVAVVIAGYFRTWKMAVAALAALIHDLVITVGIYALVGFEVTPASVIGFLTILGYSLYDTVVVFDKVRENTAGITGQTRRTYSDAANLALNQTLVRSINTSVVALLPVGAILFIGAFLLGAGTLKDLSLALFVGIATGTYSSVFIATPLLADLREREPEMKTLRRRVLARRAEGPKPAAAARPRRGRAATAVLDRPGDGGGDVTDDGTSALAGGDARAATDVATGSAGSRGTAGATAAGSAAARRRGTGPRNQPRRGGSRSKRR